VIVDAGRGVGGVVVTVLSRERGILLSAVRATLRYIGAGCLRLRLTNAASPALRPPCTQRAVARRELRAAVAPRTTVGLGSLGEQEHSWKLRPDSELSVTALASAAGLVQSELPRVLRGHRVVSRRHAQSVFAAAAASKNAPYNE
jgi:hypothetical protein